MPFDNQVVLLSATQLDNLFESSPEGTPNADTLIVGKETTAAPAIKEPETPIVNSQTQQFIDNKGVEQIPFYDESLDAPAGKDTIIGKAADGDASKLETKDTELGKASPATPADNPAIDEVLTNTVDYLIKSGKWVDFEGREDLKITEEVYADLAAKQDDYRIGQLFNELLDSTGDYGKAIITHIKAGGNPDEIIDLFKEQKQIEQIDTSTEVGKQAKIEKYYSDVLGWKPDRVQKTVKRLITDDEIENEFADIEPLYDQHFKEELAKTQQKVKDVENENRQRQLTFENNIKNVLKEDSTLSESDKRFIQNSVFDFKHKLPNGQKVNDFYVKFAEMQADPKQYVDFVRWVMDKETYIKSIARKEETKANQKAFSFLKAGAALSKTKASPVELESQQKEYKGTDFSFAISKK